MKSIETHREWEMGDLAPDSLESLRATATRYVPSMPKLARKIMFELFQQRFIALMLCVFMMACDTSFQTYYEVEDLVDRKQFTVNDMQFDIHLHKLKFFNDRYQQIIWCKSDRTKNNKGNDYLHTGEKRKASRQDDVGWMPITGNLTDQSSLEKLKPPEVLGSDIVVVHVRNGSYISFDRCASFAKFISYQGELNGEIQSKKLALPNELPLSFKSFKSASFSGKEKTTLCLAVSDELVLTSYRNWSLCTADRGKSWTVENDAS